MRRATIRGAAAAAGLAVAAGLAAAAVGLAACARNVQGSGTIVTRTVPVPGTFDAVKGEGALSLVVRQGETPGITVRSDDNLVDLVLVEAEDGALRVFTRDSWSSTDGLVVTVTAPRVGGIAASGAVQASVDLLARDDGQAWAAAGGASSVVVEEVRSKSLRVRADGASKVTVERAEAAELDAKAVGASTIVVRGACDRAVLHAEGASRVGDAGLRAKVADVVVAGASHAELDVAESLRADALGVSTITYGGEPDVKGTVGKSASVKKR